MKRRTLIKTLMGSIPALGLSKFVKANDIFNDSGNEPIAQGPFQPAWNSLKNYQIPDWFRDAKFGIWAHWGRNVNPNMATGMRVQCT